MKLKVKKCPKCGFELRVANSRIGEGVFEPGHLRLGLGDKRITICDPENIADYDAIEDCPSCEIPLEDVPEEK